MNGKVVFTLNKDGYYTWICRAIEKVSGYTQEEILGTSAFNYVYSEDMARVLEGFSKLEIEEYRENSFRVVNKNGEVAEIVTRMIRIPDGTIIGVFDRRRDDRD